MDQEPLLTKRQIRHALCNEAKAMLVDWLRKRADEIVRESDADERGVETIMRWLQTDVARFQAIIECMDTVDNGVQSDGCLETIYEYLERLLFVAKSVLFTGKRAEIGHDELRNQGNTTGWDFVKASEQHAVLVDKYNLTSVGVSEFRHRFKLVSCYVESAIKMIDGQTWSDETHGS